MTMNKGIIIALFVFAIISVFVLGPILSSAGIYEPLFESLDKKRNTVVALVASSSAASAVITLIPDDVGTPIAEQLAALSTGFTLILAVLLVEKYLLPLLGGLTSYFMLPIICILLIINVLDKRKQWLKNTIIKLIVLAIACSTLIPLSVYATNKIEETFETSINNTISVALESDDTLSVEEEKDKSLWEKITGAVSGALDYVGKAVDIAKNVLGNYVEAIAVMLVTSCVIPIIVLLVYALIIRYVFRLDFSIRDIGRRVDHSFKRRYKMRAGEALREGSLTRRNRLE